MILEVITVVLKHFVVLKFMYSVFLYGTTIVCPKYQGTMSTTCGSAIIFVHVIFHHIYHVFLDMVKEWYYCKYLGVPY